jgi:hypothetical protein
MFIRSFDRSYFGWLGIRWNRLEGDYNVRIMKRLVRLGRCWITEHVLTFPHVEIKTLRHTALACVG